MKQGNFFMNLAFKRSIKEQMLNKETKATVISFMFW